MAATTAVGATAFGILVQRTNAQLLHLCVMTFQGACPTYSSDESLVCLQGIPPAALAKVSSDSLRELITTCIAHDPAARPGALQLLKHAFFADLAGAAVAAICMSLILSHLLSLVLPTRCQRLTHTVCQSLSECH